MDSKENIREQVKTAIAKGNSRELKIAVDSIWQSENPAAFADLLAELLIVPGHQDHQEIAKYLQDHAPQPDAIPYIRIALADLSYLAYTGSDSGAIAKWFSWLLYAIDTDEAIEVMEEYSQSPDEGIRTEMLYRLDKVKKK